MRHFFFAVILLTFVAAATAKDYFFYPGVYYTYGDISTDIVSRESSAYLTISDSDIHFLTLGYSNLHQTYDSWTWEQQMLVGGALLSHYPYAAKLQYGHLWGLTEYKDFRFYGTHIGDMYSGEGIRYFRRLTTGLGYSQFHQFEAIARISQIYFGRFHYLLSDKSSFLFKPTFTWTNDGRRLYAADLHFYATLDKKLFASTGVTLGERAFYYDSDLLVMDNQIATLNGRGFVKLTYELARGLHVSGEYLYTRYLDSYENYTINYYVAGLTYRHQVHQ